MRRLSIILLATLAHCASDDHGPGPTGTTVEGASGTLTVTAPLNGSLLASRAVTVEGIVQARGASEVSVNGTVAELREDGGFSALIALPEGRASLVVAVLDLTAHLEVEVDSIKPTVALTEPVPGSFIEGTHVRFRGRAEDLRLETVLLDGVAVSVSADGSFEAVREVGPGPHRMRMEAVDAAQHHGYSFTSFVAGSYRRPGAPIDEAAGLFLGPNALSVVSTGATSVLGTVDLERVLLERNPVTTAWWGATIVLSFEHSSVEVAIAPGDGALDVAVTLHDVDLRFELVPDIGPRVSGQLRALDATLTAPVRLRTSVDGRVTATLGDPTVALDGLVFMLDWTPAFVENSATVRGWVTGWLEQGIVSAVQERLPPYLEQAMSRVPMGATFDPGQPLAISGRARSVSTTPAGVTLWVDAGIAALNADSRADGVPGSVLFGGRAPLRHDTPGVAVDVALDALNAGAFAAWSGGHFDSVLDHAMIGGRQVTVRRLSLLVPSLTASDVLDAPVAFYVRWALPPIFTPAADGTIEATLADVRVRAVARPVGGVEQPLLELSVSLSTPVSADVANNEVFLVAGSTVVSADPVSGPDDVPVSQELDDLVSLMVAPQIAAATAEVRMPIPSLLGFTVDAHRPTITDNYLLLTGDLRSVP